MNIEQRDFETVEEDGRRRRRVVFSDESKNKSSHTGISPSIDIHSKCSPPEESNEKTMEIDDDEDEDEEDSEEDDDDDDDDFQDEEEDDESVNEASDREENTLFDETPMSEDEKDEVGGLFKVITEKKKIAQLEKETLNADDSSKFPVSKMRDWSSEEVSQSGQSFVTIMAELKITHFLYS